MGYLNDINITSFGFEDDKSLWLFLGDTSPEPKMTNLVELGKLFSLVN